MKEKLNTFSIRDRVLSLFAAIAMLASIFAGFAPNKGGVSVGKRDVAHEVALVPVRHVIGETDGGRSVARTDGDPSSGR